MTTEELQLALDNLVLRCLDKGLASPKVQIQFESNKQPHAWVTFTLSEAGEYKSEYFRDDYLFDLLGKITHFINDIPTREDRERNEYLRKLAATIEYGRKIGIDESFVNPLELQMKKLSSNIIEYKPAFNDEIPF